ncbi:MAG TPA: glycosyltransferase family 9 protein [Candidatus Acidoferrales bacterium]|nr:glycosyltransferase family 9 protein [Candidatus Acidoferrales bacterium]
MDRETKFRTFFKLSSVVTDIFPNAGGRFLDAAFKTLLGNRVILNLAAWSTKNVVKKNNGFNSFLFVADLNIGDAVIGSSAVAAMREIFPEAEIDFVIKKSTIDFVRGNPDISNLYPIYEGAPFPTEEDTASLTRLALGKNYDLIVNFSPMIDEKIFGGKNVVNYAMMAAQLVRNERFRESINNVSYQAYNFIRNAFGDFLPLTNGREFEGARIYLSEDAIEEAEEFLLLQDISEDRPILFFNPDASARFTRIPFDTQRSLLKKLSILQCSILLGSGHVEKHIEHELMYSLPPEVRRNIFIVPSFMSIDVYAALMDYSDIFVTGDTGPLHLAAARKFARRYRKPLRNKTAVFSIFGGTPPRIYGYDSRTPGFFPANQDAPSRTFVAGSPCRNITCINKSAKTCREVRCFDYLNTDEIVSEAARHLQSVVPSRREKVLVHSK